MFWGELCLTRLYRWCRFRVFPFRSQNSMWFDFMLFYPVTILITGMEKKAMMCVCVCVYNNSPSSPSRGSISPGPPPWLPSDKVNKVCLANPARKYLFWKLPHPTGDTHTSAGIYTVTILTVQYYICTHIRKSGSIDDPGQTLPRTSTQIHLNLPINCTSPGN